MSVKSIHSIKALVSIILLLGISTFVYASNEKFHSPYFDLSLNNKLTLISKTEEPDHSFYRYVFSSSDNEDGKLQMRIIVSSKGPEKNQSLETFQTEAVSSMSVMFIDSFQLYQYLSTPENQRVLSRKPDKLKLGSAIYSGVTMYFGNIDMSFLVTNHQEMTYAFTLISRGSNKATRKSNLKALTNQLSSIKFNSN